MPRMIDMSTFPRRAHFAHFTSMANPFVGVTVNVDVTPLVRRCQARKESFYLMMIHLTALAADAVPQLRQRIRDGGIVEYEHCPTSHTELLEDESYCYCTLRHDMPVEDYAPYAEAVRERALQNASLEEDDDVESMYFISCLPWLHYTSFTQPTGGDSNPRFAWGKWEQDARGRLMLPYTLLAHHALVDGLHMARFFERLQQEILAMA